MILPTWCVICGKVVTFSNEERCEDCYATDQSRFSGKSARVKAVALREESHDVPLCPPPWKPCRG
jgi:hypothetical protein